jgi:hypothetical protein
MHIDRQLFMGAGDHSLAQVGYLHQQLSRAITTLGGIQQAPMSTDPNDPDWDTVVEEGQHEVDQIAREIYLALTGERPPMPERDSQPAKEAAERDQRETWMINLGIGAILAAQIAFFLYMFFFL